MKLSVDLKNCYGISELVHEFDFGNSNGYAIYAPNGFMKTSFSKTFDDLAKGRDTKDLIFPDRASSRVIKDDAGNDIVADSVFVVEPYNADFSSEKTSLLLVNGEVKQKYDDALKEIADKQTALFAKLKQLSGLTGRTVTPETEILKWGVSEFLCVRRCETFPRRRTALATYRPTRWESRSSSYATPFVNLSS
jgi:hypothetical protein